jgi:hypothetical protein
VNVGLWKCRIVAIDPNPPYTFLQSGQSNKSAFYELDAKKAAFGDFNQSVNKRQ